MRKWLARLSFSLFILAAVFAWEGYRTQRGDRGPGRQWAVYSFYVGAALCFGLGLRGVRERHRILGQDRRADRDAPDDPRNDS